MVSGRYRDPNVVRPEDVPLSSGMVRVIPPNRPTRVHRGMLQHIWWQLNSIKTILFLFRCGISRVVWEKRWLRYVMEHWSNEPIRWRSLDMVYTGVAPFSRKEYHGETSIGFRPRINTHKQLGDKRSQTMQLYKFMKMEGRSRLIWMPLITWDDSILENRPTKSTRLVAEAWEVYQRQSELNNLGKNYGAEEADVFAERMMLGRRKRGRQLLKFRLAPQAEQLLLPTPSSRTTKVSRPSS